MNETGVDQKTISSKYLEMDDFSLQQREKAEWKCEREKRTEKIQLPVDTGTCVS